MTNAHVNKSTTHLAVAYLAATCLIASCLTACQTTKVRPAAPAPAAPLVSTAGARHYRVDSAASELHILVYRGGPMAHLGHNHVLSSPSVEGDIYLQDDVSKSLVSLALPVDSLVVDDAQARSVEGDDFSAAVPDEAREGTRQHLMQPETLDAEHYPMITLQSVAIGGTRHAPQLTMRVTLKGVARDVDVNATVIEDDHRLTATGEFSILQTDFGITPFSVALGALKVQDGVRIKFKIVAAG